jgi:hypothetical protein
MADAGERAARAAEHALREAGDERVRGDVHEGWRVALAAEVVISRSAGAEAREVKPDEAAQVGVGGDVIAREVVIGRQRAGQRSAPVLA